MLKFDASHRFCCPWPQVEEHIAENKIAIIKQQQQTRNKLFFLAYTILTYNLMSRKNKLLIAAAASSLTKSRKMGTRRVGKRFGLVQRRDTSLTEHLDRHKCAFEGAFLRCRTFLYRPTLKNVARKGVGAVYTQRSIARSLSSSPLTKNPNFAMLDTAEYCNTNPRRRAHRNHRLIRLNIRVGASIKFVFAFWHCVSKVHRPSGRFHNFCCIELQEKECLRREIVLFEKLANSLHACQAP